MLQETKEELYKAQQVDLERTVELIEANRALETMLTEQDAAILRLNRLYTVLSSANKAIVSAKDRDMLFSKICRGAVELGGFKMAWIGLVDEESGMVRPVSQHGDNDGFLEQIRIFAREVPEGMGPTGSAIRDGSYYICNDMIHDPRTIPWHEEAREHGICSAASVALTMNNMVIGALTIYSVELNYFCDLMIDLLKQMGMDISFALNNLDHAVRFRNTEQALHEETAERLRLLEALRNKEQQFMQQSRHAAMGEMIGNIAHQWRQPLNALALIIQHQHILYEEDKLSREDLNQNFNTSMELIDHMSRTIGDFTDFFRPDKEKSIFNVRKEISKTLSLTEVIFSDQRIRIEVNHTEDAVTHGYPNEYAQVLLNILINARDAFTSRKAEKPRIIVDLSSEGGKSVVTIADNAGGIPEEIIDRIFDPYFTTKEPDKGTGVGLYMSKIIIEKNMSGSLTARNTGDGAEFRIEV